MNIVNKKELQILCYLIQTADTIMDYHKKGKIFYLKELSNTTYGWHNIKFPPEYREYTLSKKNGQPLCKEYDLYYLFMEISEMINKDSTSLSLVLRGGVWQREMQKSMVDWESDISNAFLFLIKKCTAKKSSERLTSFEDIKSTQEWMLLQRQYIKYVEYESI